MVSLALLTSLITAIAGVLLIANALIPSSRIKPFVLGACGVISLLVFTYLFIILYTPYF